VSPNPRAESYRHHTIYTNKVVSAWTEVWSDSYRSRASILTMIPEDRNLEAFFVFLGGAEDIYNSIRMPNYCDGPYIHRGLYVYKVLSAWTEVWSGSYR